MTRRRRARRRARRLARSIEHRGHLLDVDRVPGDAQVSAPDRHEHGGECPHQNDKEKPQRARRANHPAFADTSCRRRSDQSNTAAICSISTPSLAARNSWYMTATIMAEKVPYTAFQ